MADVRDGSAFRIPVGRHSSCLRGGAVGGPGSGREPARRGVRGRGPAAQRRLLRSGVGRTPTQTARPRRPIAPRRLARPRVDLSEYKGVQPPFNQWSHVADVCGKLSDAILSACVRALRADASPEARQAQTRVDNWREARATGQTPPLTKLPGLKT